jgi:hypothetical protein
VPQQGTLYLRTHRERTLIFRSGLKLWAILGAMETHLRERSEVWPAEAGAPQLLPGT